MICVEFQKQRMTTGEARRAYGEMVESLEPDHAEEVEEMIEEAERANEAAEDAAADD
jgi:precorrin-3B methylase